MLLLAAGAVWWLLFDGPGGPEPDDPYAPALEGADAEPGLEGREAPGRAGAEARPEEGPAEPDVVDAGTGVVLVGRVVDPRRVPVADARVTARFPGRAPYDTRTDREGRYELAVGERPAMLTVGTLRARTDDGRVGAGPVSLQPSTPARRDVPALVVDQALAFDVRVEHAGAPRPDARVVVARQVWGRVTPILEGTTDAEGRFRADGVLPGHVGVFVAAEGYGRNVVGLHLPRVEEGPVVVELLEERRLTVRVVDQATQRPVEGARVHVADRNPTGPVLQLGLLPSVTVPPTGPDGVTTVPTLNARDAYYVEATAEGYALPDPRLDPPRAIEPDAREVTRELRRFRTVRFPVKTGSAPVPRDDTPLELELLAWMAPVFAPDAAARLEAGHLVVTGLPPTLGMGRVRTPEGRTARFTAVADKAEGPPVTFVQALEARVRIVERGRGPLKGVRVRWRGGLAFGDPQVAVTDAKGEATLSGMEAGEITVMLLTSSDPYRGVAVGTIALNEGNADELHVLEIEPPHALTIEVSLDGEPGLPPAYDLRIGRRWVTPTEIEEDPEAGALTVLARTPGRGEPLPVQLRARGYTSGEATIRGGGAETVAVSLRKAAELTVHVAPPADGDVALVIERYDPEQGTWARARVQRAEADDGRAVGGRQEASAQTFLIPEPGRYRARDQHADVRSEPVDIALGYPAETAIDLSRMAWVRIRVEAEGAGGVERARVFRTDVAPDHPLGAERGVPVDRHGRAEMRARIGERVVLSVRHPLLTPAAEGGRAAFTADPSKPVVLRLEMGNVLRFRIARGESEAAQPNRATSVVLSPTADFGDPGAIRAMTIVEDGQHLVGGFAPGTYHLWIDTFRRAPIVLASRTLGVGTTDLGLLTPPAGAVLRVKVLGAAGSAAPPLWVVARRQGVPALSRIGVRPKGSTDDVRVAGLGPGTYEVSLRGSGVPEGTLPPAQTVEVGDGGVVLLTFDLGGR